jgi:hypothetical protein
VTCRPVSIVDTVCTTCGRPIQIASENDGAGLIGARFECPYDDCRKDNAPVLKGRVLSVTALPRD